jgi:hypothetical protein
MTSKKLMISMTVMALLLVGTVVLIVHNNKSDGPKALEITADSPFIGAWHTASVKDKSSADYLRLDLSKNGKVNGDLGKYELTGTWAPVSDTTIEIKNKKGETAYTGTLKNDELLVAGKAVTDSSSWTLDKIQ